MDHQVGRGRRSGGECRHGNVSLVTPDVGGKNQDGVRRRDGSEEEKEG